MPKFLFTFSVRCILLLTLLHQVNAGPNDPVNIPDLVLRAVIAARLNKSSGAPITESEMNRMTGLISYRKGGISDLTGLEHATGIDRLHIDGSNITDLSPLARLTTLTDLQLNRNQIVDVTHLKNLTALTQLDLGSNKITNIEPLKALTNLTILTLNRNRSLSNISHLKNLTKMIDLHLSSTSVTDSGLSAVLPSFSSLELLSLNYTPLSDLSVLNKLPVGTKLRSLSLQGMWGPSRPRTQLGLLLKDISPLVEFMQAKKFKANARVIVAYNYYLDYDSFYTHIPVLFSGGVEVVYKTRDPDSPDDEKDPEPGIESASEESTVGRPGTRYTFVVRAYNRMHNYFYAFNTADVNYGPEYHLNTKFKGVPVTWRVTYPDGSTSEPTVVKTGNDGLSRFAVTLGNHGDVHTAEAFVPANTSANGPTHPQLRVRSFTATSDRNAPIPAGLTVTFEDYPEDRPTEEFPLTIKFSQPVTGFETENITVETELERGTGTATLKMLTPIEGPAQTYTATIGVPTDANGTVKLIVNAGAALSSISGQVGPATDTASEPIEFGKIRRVRVFPSHVAMDKVIFNEFRNAEDDTHDWIELKNISDEDVPLKDWEISIVASEGEYFNIDRDVVAFPDYTLPASGILLIVNTDPSETDLIRGRNIENPRHNPDTHPQYLMRPEMQLPSSPYLLILRSVRDKNGKWEGFEDLLGDYYRGDVNYRTQIWPLRDTWVHFGTEARFSEDEVYQRVMRPKGVIPVKPSQRGYLRDAWVLNEYHAGLGYRPEALPETSLGTPGYPVPVLPGETGTGQISFSEVMIATNERASLSQWIELYNNSSEMVDLEGWTLGIEVRESRTAYHYTPLILKSLAVMPNQTVLLVARNARTSENIPMRRIYNVYHQNGDAFRIGAGANKILGSEGFALRLLSPDGTLVDMAGNLNRRQGLDKPRWRLPEGWTEGGARSSLIRRYEDRVPAQGTIPGSWVRAADTSLIGPHTYWGLSTDNGTPGYRQGSPLPVTLSSFRADRKDNSVVVKWTTASEMENAGFYVLRRRDRASDFVQVSPALIPGAGTTAERQTYTYRDTTAQRNVPYDYRLEEVSLPGERRGVATVRLRGHVSAANKRQWKWADVKFAD